MLTDGGKRGAGRLLLSLRPGVAPEWYAAEWVQGRKRTAKLGTFPDMSLSDAREKFKSGVAFDRPAKTGTLEQLIQTYVTNLKANGKRTADEIERTLYRMADVIGRHKQANQVTTDDIVEMLRPVYAAGKSSMADHMRGAMHAAYGWVIKSQNDYRTKSAIKATFGITSNPASGIPTEPKVSGERWLSEEELRAFWKWVRAGGTKNENRNTDPRNYVALQVLILTGQRVEEVLRIDTTILNRQMGILDWSKTKVGNAHVIPATAQVLRRLTCCRRIGSGLFFPRYANELEPTDDSTLRAICKAYVRQSGIAPFTTRDLRRTWKTNAGIAGLTKTERDLLQNHANSDVSSKHYDRYDYLPEKRAALAKWEAWLLKKENPS